jgi:hypothetical protein
MFPWRTPKPAPMVRRRPEDAQVPVGVAEGSGEGWVESDLDLTSED